MSEQKLESAGPIEPIPDFESLAELLSWRAAISPEKTGYTFWQDNEFTGVPLTYAALYHKAGVLAAHLQTLAEPGERALLLYPSGPDYIVAFFGCLLAGIIAVPAYPPAPTNRRKEADFRLAAIMQNARPVLVLTTSALLTTAQAQLPPGATWVTTDNLEETPFAYEGNSKGLNPETPAFLQYTSGSTGTPKGVMLTHRNLLYNLKEIYRVFGNSALSRGVSWLPPYHDMGLIGGILQPLYAGFQAHLLPPMAFLQRPLRWLEAISREKATISGAPNFAYDLCISRATPEQLTRLDLTSWEVAFVGAEPVRAETLERFAATFEPCGFRREAFLPCYGLAEATLLVSGTRNDFKPGRVFTASPPPENFSQPVVSCGKALPSQRLAIVNPVNRREQPPGTVGEIWLSGPGVAGGYWNLPGESKEVFKATLANEPFSQTPFLRTGDLGFLGNDRLFISGRLKDLIIIRGQNHYPQDIEQSVEKCHPALRSMAGAVFSIEMGREEKLVVVQEVGRSFRHGPFEKTITAIRQAVAADHGLQVYAITLVNQGSIPRTTSGKIQRGACKERFSEGKLNPVASEVLDRSELFDIPAEPAPGLSRADLAGLNQVEQLAWLEEFLVERLAGLLHLNPQQISRPHSPAALGLDSLGVVELQHALESQLAVVLPISDFLESKSLPALARQILEHFSPIAPLKTGHFEGVGPPGEPFPLSYNQKSLWYLHQLAPESSAYHINLAFRIKGSLNSNILKRSFQKLIERHTALRTGFGSVEGEPYQFIRPEPDLFFKPVEAALWSEAELKSRLDRIVREPFDLENDPLFKIYLFKLAGDENLLFIKVHHLVVDLSSLIRLGQELGQFYRAAVGEIREPQTPPVSQYSDFLTWQTAWLTTPEGQNSRDFWLSRFKELPPALDLPLDFPRHQGQAFKGASKSIVLNDRLCQRLYEIAREKDVTLFTLLLAGFGLLLHRYSGQTDFVIGTPTAGRTRPEWSDTVGYLVNPVPIRINLSEDLTFEALLARLRRTVLEALDHQAYPLARLVQELNPGREASRSPLFQVLFGLQHFSPGDFSLPGLAMELIDLAEQSAQFDLSLTIRESAGGLRATLQYNSTQFEPETAAQILRHFEVILQSVSEETASSVASVPLLTAAEHVQILEDWNNTDRQFPAQSLIHHLFERQAELTPPAPALFFENEVLTYAELNERANRLAHFIGRSGAGPEQIIGVCLERTPLLIITLLAILKSGSAYLPLDPNYPSDRLAFLLADTGAKLLITQASLTGKFQTGPAEILLLDRDVSRFEQENPANPNLPGDARNLAYLIYTSGSTGQPKGVAITHRNVMALLDWAKDIYGEAQLKGVLAATALTFDLSVFEIFLPLARGGAVILAETALELARLPAREFVTLVNTVPSVLAELLHQGALPAGITTINLAGESLGATLARQALSQPGVKWVYNLYGPSEDTTYSTLYPVPADLTGNPLIGRPISNTRVYILNSRLEPQPVNVPGELYLAGEGLARGYHNRPALTAEKFRPDPFSQKPGARMYRTGDRARFKPDGSLEFLGRLDNQLKIRGLRIEPGEIEAGLLQHPGLREAVVVARESRLVAFVVPQKDTPVSSAELKQHLEGILPGYMVPRNFVTLAALPLTPHGKLNRAALPEPPLSLEGYVPPQTPLEKELAEIWGSLLNLPKVGLQDNFFEAGGHSLLAMQFVSRLKSRFNLDINLRRFLEFPTIAEFAPYLQATFDEEAAPTRRPGAIPWPDVLPLSFSQEQLWLLAQFAPDNPVYNIPLAVRLTGLLDTGLLEKSFRALIRRHESLRTVFGLKDGTPYQLILETFDFSLPVIDLQNKPGAVETFVKAELQKPFDLGNGPLFRVNLVRLNRTEYLLLLCLHHIIADGWSLHILARDLAAFYRGSGEAGELPPLPIQIADFALYQQALLGNDRLAKQLAYWKYRLAEAPLISSLRPDYPRPAVQTYRGQTNNFKLDAALTQRLQRLARREKTTLFVVLLSAFQVLLARFSGEMDVLVGSVFAERRLEETQNLIGCLVNTVALRAKLAGNPTFQEFLGRTGELVLEAHENQDVPFERVVQELKTVRDLSINPLFQVMFVFQNTPPAVFDLPGLAWQVMESQSNSSKFDLTLSISETGAGLEGQLEYNLDLYSDKTIGRFLEGFRLLLEEITEGPAKGVLELNLLGPDERRKILTEWNNTALPLPQSDTLASLFVQQARRTPDQLALSWGDRSMTYRELDRLSNQLARYLLKGGARPEEPVGICLERNADLLVTLLAVLKTGAPYLPLDPGYPVERNNYMLHDSGARLLVSRAKLLEDLQLPSQVSLIRLDHDHREIAAQSAGTLQVSIEPDSLAYVIYTSGSTGQPKGVGLTHRNAAAFIRWVQSNFQPAELDRVIFSTSICFDLSIFEIFGPLSQGGTVIILENLLQLPTLPPAVSPTLLNTVPSGLAEILRISDLPASLQTLNLAGEALPPALAQKLDCLPGFRQIYNLYGPTECTTYATFAGVGQNQVTIGRPVANTQVYLLDTLLNPVPVGVIGEIFLGGVQLARGYVNQAGLTAEKFLPDPFATEPGQRLYRTGDKAYYREDGHLVFLGRSDDQLKIRGYRIEPSEIEATLNQHPGVRMSVVLPNDNLTSLNAYLVAGEGFTPSARELHTFLAKTLPAHMIPGSYHFLKAFPYTQNGKIDRQKLLKEAGNVNPGRYQNYEEPGNEVEATIFRLWKEALKIETLGIHDNFFEIGGHSLLAIQIITDIQNYLGVTISIRQFFENATVADLAAIVQEAPILEEDEGELALLLSRIENMPDAEVQNLLAKKMPPDSL
jgi:amino acid adenylation domain-containing protein